MKNIKFKVRNNVLVICLLEDSIDNRIELVVLKNNILDMGIYNKVRSKIKLVNMFIGETKSILVISFENKDEINRFILEQL